MKGPLHSVGVFDVHVGIGGGESWDRSPGAVRFAQGLCDLVSGGLVQAHDGVASTAARTVWSAAVLAVASATVSIVTDTIWKP